MSLDIYVKNRICDKCGRGESSQDFNITHNLGKMAGAAGIYEALWRPYQLHKDYKDFGEDYVAEMEFEKTHPMYAKDILPLLEKGLAMLKDGPDYYKKFDATNGWGTYEHFVPFVEEVLEEYKKYPDGELQTSR